MVNVMLPRVNPKKDTFLSGESL
uniref:Uncharacterized protein n=1 Tax=Anguilla anguilla TaxID=7936 RepID=A0A0E9VAB5_ANGAN